MSRQRRLYRPDVVERRVGKPYVIERDLQQVEAPPPPRLHGPRVRFDPDRLPAAATELLDRVAVEVVVTVDHELPVGAVAHGACGPGR
jgi:hypothetical protein